MASGTALIYDDEMTSHRLLWDDPICAIEVPKRLSSCYERLKCYNLVERCISVPTREGTEEEIMLVHSSDYLEIVKSTEKMNEGELRKISVNYDAVYFHPTTYCCAKLAVGATLELVDTVMSGKARNGMALVRPPGHHSQRNAANGFCIFNNVAIAAEFAKRKYGLQRILIVDWDVHHGQGIQYLFEEDPSVLYFSWHRYEHQQFWPLLKESNYDAVGQGKGRGFNINVPWNQVGMGNSDYLAVFLHVLLPVAFEFDPELVLVSAGYDSGIGDPEGRMSATPECFAHLTHFLMQLAKGKLCLVLEGGYHLRSLSESVCMTIKTALGDPLPRLSGEMAPCLSAIESIHNVRAIHKQYWKCLMYEDATPLQFVSTRSYPMEEAEALQTGPPLVTQQEAGSANSDEVIKTERFLEQHMKEIMTGRPPVKTAGAIVESESHLLPPSVQIERTSDAQKELKTIVSELDPELLKEEHVLNSLVKMLAVLDKIVKKEVTNGLAVSPVASVSTAIALKHCSNLRQQKILCIFVGDLDLKIDLDDGRAILINICAKQPEQANTKYNISLTWKKDVETNSCFSMILGAILPVAYSYQPDLTILVIGPNRSLSKNGISLLIGLLQGLAESRILVLIQDTERGLLQDVAKLLTGDYIPYFGTYAPASKESMQMLKKLREQFQEDWKMLRCFVMGTRSS
ncbi:polyamine deacetylase HDAC10 [Tiliqua scincoides]|uniref:polyamine deacetylase HDAC10 n=1 Tax=Tiliqua scincoides TaxID=71010 RepID=UPI003461C5C1